MKLCFFNEVGLNVPSYVPVDVSGIPCVPTDVICAMKLKTIFERSVFRDYYDLFCIFSEEIVAAETALKSAISYQPMLTEDGIIKRLTNSGKFPNEKTFAQLSPKYDVKTKEIGEYFKKVFK